MDRKDVVRDFGQLFILAFDGPVLSRELIEFFRTFRIGGLIFFSDNFRDPRQFAALVADIQKYCSADGTPLFITIDHEGGKRQEFQTGLTRIPPMASFGQKSVEETLAVHRLIARELHDIGINLDFAPVADINENDSQGSIGDRSFGSDPQLVSAHVAAAIEGLQGEGVLACAKHFPGHGATRKNSHVELPVVSLTRDELELSHMIPFKKAIAAGVSCIMTAHIVYPNAGDAELPVSLSPYWTTDVLRHQLGFEGLIITDALEMKALTNHWSHFDCGMKALHAGADQLIYYREKNQFQTFYELRLALERGELDHTLLAQSIRRVKTFKGRLQP
jgi:beta-N-acetylhexosaminidase